MQRFAIRIALRQRVLLRIRVQYPQHTFAHFSRGDWLATRPIVRKIFLGKMFPDPFPLRFAHALHA